MTSVTQLHSPVIFLYHRICEVRLNFGKCSFSEEEDKILEFFSVFSLHHFYKQISSFTSYSKHYPRATESSQIYKLIPSSYILNLSSIHIFISTTYIKTIFFVEPSTNPIKTIFRPILIKVLVLVKLNCSYKLLVNRECFRQYSLASEQSIPY